mmetsp:Transcript_9344/g.13908  ORF Transcript_9344/g.13908 Transcript_9344/m.13908 type:complete len:494 (+) Transcript_9344:2-1483(+)
MMQFGGEVYPITQLESVTCLIFELIGIILMTIIYGNIIEIVSRGMKDATKLDENLSLLNSIDDRLNLPKKLVEEITDYFVNIHNSDSFREELTEFVKSLPPSLSKSVYKYLLSKCLDSHLYLKDLSLGVRYGLLSLVIPEMTNPDQVIAQQGNSANYLYFIIDGTVEVHLSTHSQKDYLQEKTTIALLRHGEDFGFCGVLNTLGRYTYTAVSQKYNSLLKLELKKVFELLDFDLRMVKNYKNKELLLHETHYRRSFDLMKMVPYLNPRNLEESFEIISTVHREYFPKFTELIRRGEKQYQVFYVEKGTVALKYRMKAQDPLIIDYLPRGSVYGLYSFKTQKSIFDLETVEDSIVQTINFSDLEKIQTKVRKLKNFKAIYDGVQKDDYIIKNQSELRKSIIVKYENFHKLVFFEDLKTMHDTPRTLLKVLKGTVLKVMRGVYDKKLEIIRSDQPAAKKKPKYNIFERENILMMTKILKAQKTLLELIENNTLFD